MKFKILILSLLLISNLACNQNTSKETLFSIKVIPENTAYNGAFNVTLDGGGNLTDDLFHLTKINDFEDLFRTYPKSKQMLDLDITLLIQGGLPKSSFPDLPKILAQIKSLAEKYQCRTIVCLHFVTKT